VLLYKIDELRIVFSGELVTVVS